MQTLTKEQAIKLIKDSDSIEVELYRELLDITQEEDTKKIYKPGTLYFTLKGKSQSQFQRERTI
jgi:hypothetical protein